MRRRTAAENLSDDAPRQVATLAPRPLRRRKLYEDIVQHLEGLIVSGELRPRDLLPSERELMTTFQVGRTSVREALFALQRMGLVALRNGERASVTLPSAEGMLQELSGAARHLLSSEEGAREFQQARTIMEGALARHAAERATDDEIAALSAALQANGASIGDMDRFTRTDVAFHLQVARISSNSIFVALHGAVSRWLVEQRTVGLVNEGADRAAFAAHTRIFEAIAARRPDSADQAMRAHLAEVEAYYWATRSPK